MCELVICDLRNDQYVMYETNYPTSTHTHVHPGIGLLSQVSRD